MKINTFTNFIMHVCARNDEKQTITYQLLILHRENRFDSTLQYAVNVTRRDHVSVVMDPMNAGSRIVNFIRDGTVFA